MDLPLFRFSWFNHHFRSKIHKQTRGHTLSSVVHENLETMAIGIRQSDVAESSTHGREKNILADRLSRFKVYKIISSSRS
jgi:hypothetical protein